MFPDCHRRSKQLQTASLTGTNITHSLNIGLFLELLEIALFSVKMRHGPYVHAERKCLGYCKIDVLKAVQRCQLDDYPNVSGLEYSLELVMRVAKFGATGFLKKLPCYMTQDAKAL